MGPEPIYRFRAQIAPCPSCTDNGRYLTSFPTESSSSSPSGRCLSLPLSLTSGVLGLRVLERRARMGAHGQTAMARGLTLRKLLFSCTDEVLPCPEVSHDAHASRCWGEPRSPGRTPSSPSPWPKSRA